MSKKKTRTITMPNPCEKSWDDMSPDSIGRFCHNCSTQVIDFSNFSDSELIEFLKNLNGSHCGRFTNHQLNKPIPLPVNKNSTLLSKTLLSTALIAGFAANVNGQTIQPAAQTNIPIHNSSKKAHKDSSKHIICGYVYCTKGKGIKVPMEGVIITTAGTQLQTDLLNVITFTNGLGILTDTAGKFELYLPDDMIGKKITLQFRRDSYIIREVIINTRRLPARIKIEMEPIVYHFTGRFL